MRRVLRVLFPALLPVVLGAQQVSVAPDSLVLRVGDTARVVGAVKGHPEAALAYTGTNATAFTQHRDGRITARAVGCGFARVSYGTWTRAQVPVCVIARDTVVPPAPVPVPTPAPDTAFAFASDWSFALGNTREAVTDGGRWPALACERTFPATLTVLPGAEVGFPGANVLRVQMRGPTDCGMLQKNDAVPISTTHWGRFYVRNDETGSKNDHPVAYHNIHGSASIQGVPMARYTNFGSATEWKPGIIGDAPYPNNKWYGPRLRNGVWYRYEWQMEYVSATETRVWPRIYAMDGTLLHTASSFVNDNGDLTLADWYAAGGTITLANGGTADAELARNFGMGNEGPGSSTATMGYWYYARLALSTAGWVGR